jgi:hypothetical protein
MSKIFEVFGYPLGVDHPSAIRNRERAYCPFMEAPCDGGGNRYLSALNLKNHPDLAKQFPGIDLVQAGVCSLMVKGEPWIVWGMSHSLLKLQGDFVLSFSYWMIFE